MEATQAAVPELPHGCGSWVIVSRVTGEAVLETYSRQTVEAVNQRAYKVLTALDWLASLNKRGGR